MSPSKEKHGRLDNPSKSPYSFEKYDFGWEREYMDVLEADPDVEAWTKNHKIRIPYLASDGTKREYHPDFLLRMAGGKLELHEVKGGHLMAEAQPKFEAAKRWCAERGIEFVVVTKE